MSKQYDWEEEANLAIDGLRDFIDTESQLVEKEHELYSKLLCWENVFVHLNERMPESMGQLHDLLTEIYQRLIRIRRQIQFGSLKDLRIEKEEEQTLQKLKKDVEHKDWRAVKAGIKSEVKDEKNVLRLEKAELRELHHLFIDLMKLMKRSKLISAIEEDLTKTKEKESYENLVEYYFLHTYKFIRAYERIFRHLWRKELLINRGVKRKR